MVVEVWSDIACPFCYIGKHNFEKALQQFPEADAVKLEWKSFQLDPELPRTASYANTYEYLAERKGLSREHAEEMTAGVALTGQRAGVELNFETTVVANTWDAHRLLHLAKANGVGNRLKEILFRTHFTDGKNIGDRDTLVTLGVEAGLPEASVAAVLAGDQYGYEVAQDIQEARNIGVRGVPFFVFNRKYAVSGAQPPEVFLQTLQKSFAEWRETNRSTDFEVISGPSCTPDGNCD